jgi:RsiW-degrading membrane proteinase PrsW (M82 family)
VAVATVLVLGVAPGAFWLWYFYRRDRVEPEPRRLVLRVFLYGGLSAIPAGLVEVPFAVITGAPLAVAVIAAPVVEELAKLAVVHWTMYRHREFDEPMDGIVYAAAAALGFATVENVLYVATASRAAEDSAVWGHVAGVAVARAVLSVPGHVLFSGMWGYALGVARFSGPAKGRRLVRNGVFAAISLHAVFNALAATRIVAALGLLALIAGAWRAMNRRIRAALERSPHTGSERDGQR